MTPSPNRAQLSGPALPLALVVLISFSLCGCLHHKAPAGRPEEETLLPTLRTLFTGPCALALTNGGAFEAQCQICLNPAAEKPRFLPGVLCIRGSQVRLETLPPKSKSPSLLEFGIIWDTRANTGFVFSEALQAYAAISSAPPFTNSAQIATSDKEKMNGHTVDHATATFAGPSGQTLVMQLIRARDAQNIPLSMSSAAEPHPFLVTLDKIQFLNPPDSLFLPPDGFTKYPTEAALVGELVDRQQSVFGGGRLRTPAMQEDDNIPGGNSGYQRHVN